MLFFLASYEGREVDLNILNALEKIAENDDTFLKKKLEGEKLWELLLDRSHATYGIDNYGDKANKVTYSLLHMYSSAYENKEMLFILYWICQSITGQKLNDNFESYYNRYNELIKGKLIKDIPKILEDYSEHDEFRDIIIKSYNSDLRHLSFHNSAKLNHEAELIAGIDDPTIQVSYKEALQSFYKLQQLHNYIRMYFNILLLEEKNISNEGIFSAFTFQEDEKSHELELLQLYPFFDYDKENNNKLNTLSIDLKSNYLIFNSNKEILTLIRDDTLDTWYKNLSEDKARVFSVIPDIFEENDHHLKIKSQEYGAFIIVDEYSIKVKKSNMNF